MVDGKSAMEKPVAKFAADTPLSPRDDEKRAGLRRMKFIATGLLVLSVTVMVIAKVLEHRHPAWGFVAAFAEAATIGGLADWYAVVALFRHPMGVPVPHTAIIAQNRDRIADSLGSFIEEQFLAPEPVNAKLREIDFARQIADWLADPAKSASLTGFVLKVLPQTLEAIDGSGLKGFLSKRIVDQLKSIEVAPLAAELLKTVTQDGRHQKILDELLTAIEKILSDETALEAIREKIRAELPSIFNLFKADAFLLRKVIGATLSFVEEVRTSPDHALRGEFDSFVTRFIVNLRESPDYAERAERLKQDILARPELRGLANGMWLSLKAFVADDVRSDNSAVRGHLERLLVSVGAQLREDPAISHEINAGFVVALQTFVEEQKSSVSTFISDQVKGWDIAQLIRIIEINIGRDLQYIRVNGTIIGGLAGLALHTIETLLRLP